MNEVDKPDSAGDIVEEDEYFAPELLTINEGEVVIQDIDLLAEAVIERLDCAPLAWQFSDGDLSVLIYRKTHGFKWTNVESLGNNQASLKSVN